MPKQVSQPQPMLSIKQVAERLDASTRTIRRAIECQDLRVYRLKRLIRISEDDLADYLNRSRDRGPRLTT